MDNFRYKFAKKGKHVCPACGQKTYVLEIDAETGEPVHPSVGKCDRADNCGHRYTHGEYFRDNNFSFDGETACAPRTKHRPPSAAKPKTEPSAIDFGTFKKSLRGYGENGFVRYLCDTVGDDAAAEAIKRYFIGTSKHWDGAAVFWQIDGNGRIRAGKIMQYDGETGKRIKKPVNKIAWVHTALKLPDFNLSQCLFGEHLLTDGNKTVAIVESEKTAVIASVYLPDIIWTACGGCGNLSLKLCEVLKGRTVILYPDAGKFNEWSEKAKALSAVCTVSVSDMIEKRATEAERKAGFDLADYLVRFSPRDSGETDVAKRKTALSGHEDTEPEKRLAAYVSNDGTLYIPTQPDGRTTYTVYSGVDAYNKRSELPKTVPTQSADKEKMKRVFVDLKTLTIQICKQH